MLKDVRFGAENDHFAAQELNCLYSHEDSVDNKEKEEDNNNDDDKEE